MSADVTDRFDVYRSNIYFILTNHDLFIHFYANLILKRNTRMNFTISDFFIDSWFFLKNFRPSFLILEYMPLRSLFTHHSMSIYLQQTLHTFFFSFLFFIFVIGNGITPSSRTVMATADEFNTNRSMIASK